MVVVDDWHKDEFHVHTEVDEVEWFQVRNSKQNEESAIFQSVAHLSYVSLAIRLFLGDFSVVAALFGKRVRRVIIICCILFAFSIGRVFLRQDINCSLIVMLGCFLFAH